MMKHYFTHCLFLLLGLLTVSIASAQEMTFSADGFNCKVIGDEAVEIMGASSAIEGTLTIPTSVQDGGITYTVEAIGAEAFKGAAITEADLSEATGLKSIGESAFAECKVLSNVKFPALEVSNLTNIGALAFHHDMKIASINLEDTRIEVLESLFTKDMNDEMGFDDLTTLKLPSTLKEIKSYAMQFLGIREITIPSSVTSIGSGILEGNIYLEDFIWRDAQVTSLPRNTFLGDDVLRSVYFLTKEPIEPNGLTDKHFFMCHKDRLNVYVTKESYDILVENGYNNEVSVYSTLVGDVDWLVGDANVDGVINVADIVEIINYMKETPTASFNFKSADTNNDGVVDEADIENITSHIMPESETVIFTTRKSRVR